MNGIKYLLDTNIIIGFVQRNPVVLDLLSTKRIDQCAYSAVTRMELLSFNGMSSIEKQAIESLLKRMTDLEITRAIENETIEFRLQHQTKLPDSIIAATAKYHQLELVTLDKKLAGKFEK